MWEYLDKLLQVFIPVFQQPRRSRTSREITMTSDQVAKQFDVGGCVHRLQINRRSVATLVLEVALLIEDVRDAAAHAGSKVTPRGAQHSNQAIGHVFATMVANTFHNGCCPRVSYSESLASYTIQEKLTARGAIKCNVADKDALF